MSKITCLAIATLMVGLALLVPVAEAGEKEVKKPCCFTNARYTGVCQVQPGETETCASILAYLNNQQSAGKTYCGNTPIRGGWTSVDCKTKKTSERSTAVVCEAPAKAPASTP